MQPNLALARRSRLSHPNRLKPNAVLFMFENDFLSDLDFQQSYDAGAFCTKIKRANDMAYVVAAGIDAQSAHRQGKKIPLLSASGHGPGSMTLPPSCSKAYLSNPSNQHGLGDRCRLNSSSIRNYTWLKDARIRP